MKFYFDANLSFRIAHALDGLVQPAHYRVVHLKDLGWEQLPDVEWIGRLSLREENFIVTADTNQFTREAERNAWMKANAVVFFLTRQWLLTIGPEQAWRMVRWWPTIEDTAIRSPKRVAYRVPFRNTPKNLTIWK